MKTAFQKCVGHKLRGRHFKNRTTARKALKAAARSCARR